MKMSAAEWTLQALCSLLLVLGPSHHVCEAKPTFALPTSFAKYVGGGGATQRQNGVLMSKSYSGHRVSNESLQMVYFCDQTIAIVELAPKKLLIGCEIIEIYNDEDGIVLLNELATINRPMEIQFMEMMKLMLQCQQVDTINKFRRDSLKRSNKDANNVLKQSANSRGIMSSNPLTLFSGIIPGTKWCGTGDIARNYHDLGTDTPMDRCCRTHDLCPSKVRAFQGRYNLTNNSLYTKSHCICDDLLFNCLKETNTPASEVMGNIYFNLIQIPCLHDTMRGRSFRRARQGF